MLKQQEKSVKLSIITVTYNCADTIERTVKSVLMQNYGNYEYIVIDGESDDGTKEILDKYSDHFAYYISEPDNGIYDAMNKGIEHSTGDYLEFLNGDDYFCGEEVLCKISTYLEDNNSADVVYTNVQVGHNVLRAPAKSDLFKLHYKMPFCHQGEFFRKKLFDDDQIGKYDLKYKIASDYDWNIKAYCNNVEFIPYDYTTVHFSVGGMSSGGRGIYENYEVSKKYLKYAGCEIYDKLSFIINFYYKVSVGESVLKDIDNLILNGLTKCYIWGAGANGIKCLKLLNDCKITIKAFIDTNPCLYGTGKCGVKVIGIEEIDTQIMIIITPELAAMDIGTFLLSKGYKKDIDFMFYPDLLSKIAIENNLKFPVERSI